MPEVSDESPSSNPSRGGVFATTRWSLVLAAQGDTTEAHQALEVLCQTYWFPVYSLIRSRGVEAESARDLTQDFFAKLLSHEGFSKARRERGKFRSFLAQSVKNFLSDEWAKSRALKRGGGVTVISLDFEAAEGRYHEQPHGSSPDQEFDRQWAEQILAQARDKFQKESSAAGRGEILQVLDRLGNLDAPSLAQEASRLALPLNTLKSHLHRARARHARIIREVVAQTVSTPADVESELRHLLASLGK